MGNIGKYNRYRIVTDGLKFERGIHVSFTEGKSDEDIINVMLLSSGESGVHRRYLEGKITVDLVKLLIHESEEINK